MKCWRCGDELLAPTLSGNCATCLPMTLAEQERRIAVERTYPDGNPKTAIGATKVPLHLVPPCATHFTALAFKDGAAKYGPYNWREKGVSASVYYAAAMRHLASWWDGEDLSPDAAVHHLGHVMACCAIVLDAMTIGKLNDDRPLAGASARLQAQFGLTPAKALDMVSMDAPTEIVASPAIAEMIAQAESADDVPLRAANPVSQSDED